MGYKIPFNNLKPGFHAHREEYIEAAIRVLDSGWYVLGEEVDAFESEYASFLGIAHCVGLNSGLDALTLALRALDIGPGDEVILPANTYVATALAVTANGAQPVFVDSDEYYNIDVNLIERAVTSKTRCILSVHLYGQACDMTSIMEIARRHNLFVVEDCAQSHGAAWRGQVTGTFGDIGCFSFFPTKNIGAFGDAGAIVTHNAEIAAKVKMLRNYGSKEKYYNEIPGVNSRLDEMQAALLRVRLEHVDVLLRERALIAEKYLTGIHHPKIFLPKIKTGATHVWHLFVVQTPHRDDLKLYLEEHGVCTQIHYPVPPYLSDVYEKMQFSKDSFSTASMQADSILSLPLYNGMKEEELKYCVDTINLF